MEYVFADVHVYEARNNFWSGEIIKGVSGVSLYQQTHTERPWGLKIHCDEKGLLHSVEFENKVIWSFCGLDDRMLNIEWPLFVKDYPQSECRVRVDRFYSDSMYMTITSENACLNDILIWKVPPRGGKNGVSSPRSLFSDTA
jgi:hypothetical protein